MTTFRVWIRFLGATCRIRVDGLENAHWLLGELGRAFIFKSAEPLHQSADAPIYNFCIPYAPPLTRTHLESQIAAIPGVHLMLDPE